MLWILKRGPAAVSRRWARYYGGNFLRYASEELSFQNILGKRKSEPGGLAFLYDAGADERT
ncbi:MAG TPA: hypothetical protein DHU55_15705 [Blastocatellia bacterium]|nr:hypothetical protein [Blastocatellia bacterium]HCX31190.1 hypothetical protein [Blastocatellia bacterium]